MVFSLSVLEHTAAKISKRVVWEDGFRTWEPDESFDKKILDDINKRFTKHGKRKKTYFVKNNTQQSQA